MIQACHIIWNLKTSSDLIVRAELLRNRCSDTGITYDWSSCIFVFVFPHSVCKSLWQGWLSRGSLTLGRLPLVRTAPSITLLQDRPSIYWINTYDTIRAGGLKRQILTQLLLSSRRFYSQVYLLSQRHWGHCLPNFRGQVSMQTPIICFEIVKATNRNGLCK